MPQLPIMLYGEDVLRQKAREMEPDEINDAFRQFVMDMGETMYAASGIGLAANQVGDLRRVFVVDVDQLGKETRRRARKDPSRRNLHVMINPEIIESSIEDGEYNEGCLSIPEVEAEVWRPIEVRVRYRTLDWELMEGWVDGILARVFQHELDHLDGVLFIDHLPDQVRKGFAGALNKIKKSASETRQPSSLASAGKDSEQK
ncbi:MAG: peptide deformylase [Candidatus Sumerlaeia bacterium]|nr:peptide deformylase [Candidatus Sumerlaeia bacterium]